MAKVSSTMRQVLRRCARSPAFFIENFCKVKHPSAGILPFSLFNYQKKSLIAYKKYRYNLYRKCRQCGISTLTGAYALWLALFHPHSTVLIVSKRDLDAKEFLDKNIKFVYNQLPDSFKVIYGDPPKIWSEHRIAFPNGSSIKSLTSSKNTLRANSSTLNIIDEAAFMPDMEDMWSAGQPTLTHGGSAVVISTCNGIGNWYHSTWADAEEGSNEFNPIYIPWWDMDWEISYRDKKTNQLIMIAPTKDIRPTTEVEKIKYGPYWSPWLEEQYRALQARGETEKFRQEVLAEFLGSGNTVVPVEILQYIEGTKNDNYQVLGTAEYYHPQTDEQMILDFQNEFRVWKKPVKPQPDIIENGMIIKPGEPGHTYVMGVDVSTGEASDFSSVVVLNVDTKEQVAELNIKVIPKVLAMMVDFIAQWYNSALIVPERTGIGDAFCQELRYTIGYPNLFRRRMPNGKRDKKVGYPTGATNKPDLNKHLMDMLGEDGYQIYSSRLARQLSTYIYVSRHKTEAEPGAGNHDDLVIALALALLGTMDAVQADTSYLTPMQAGQQEPRLIIQPQDTEEQSRKFSAKGGMNLLMPVSSSGDSGMMFPIDELENFSKQLGGFTQNQMREMHAEKGAAVPRKYKINKKTKLGG